MSADPVDGGVLGRPGPQRAADPAAARARRPGRDAEVRLRRRPSGPRARPARARPRPGSRSARWRGRSCARRPASRCSATSSSSARGAGAGGHRCRSPDDLARIDADPVRCLDPDASAAMVAEVDAARRTATPSAASSRSSCYGLPPGLGSHVHWDRRLDAGWPAR